MSVLRQSLWGSAVTRRHSGAAASLGHKIHCTMIGAGITSRNVSFRAPLTSSSEMLGHSMRWVKVISQQLEDKAPGLFTNCLLPHVYSSELQIDFHSRSCACRGEIHHWFSYRACPGIQRRQHRLFICQLQHRRYRVDMARASVETLLPRCIRIHFDVRDHRLRWLEWLEWSFKRSVCLLHC